MAILTVLKYPDPFLRTKAEAVEKVDDAVRSLIEDMAETMYYARGIGLAATQVGVSKRVIVLDVPDETEEGEERERGKNLMALINPEIKEEEGSTRYEEGCLSVPGITAEVERSARVRVKALDRDGKDIELDAEGLLAIALQHEIDHINGILFIDRLSWLKRDFIKRKLKKAQEVEERAF